jgi:hypothetical protein
MVLPLELATIAAARGNFKFFRPAGADFVAAGPTPRLPVPPWPARVPPRRPSFGLVISPQIPRREHRYLYLMTQILISSR